MKQTALIKRTLEVYPENKDLLFLLEAMPIPEANAFNIAYLAVLSKGKLSQSDLTTVYAAQLQNKLSPRKQNSSLQYSRNTLNNTNDAKTISSWLRKT